VLEAIADGLLIFGLGPWVNDHDWVWIVCEIFHFTGMALLIGAVGIIDLRLLGICKGLPIARLEALVPLGVLGFVLNAVSGFVFVAGSPVGGPMDYLGNLAFQIKMLFMLVAGINLLAFYATGISREASGVGPAGDTEPNAKLVAVVSLVAWFAVIFFGRLIMYNDTLLLALGL